MSKPGDLLWRLNPVRFRDALREILLLVGHPAAKVFTLKGFRAGRATQLMKDGLLWAKFAAKANGCLRPGTATWMKKQWTNRECCGPDWRQAIAKIAATATVAPVAALRLEQWQRWVDESW